MKGNDSIKRNIDKEDQITNSKLIKKLSLMEDRIDNLIKKLSNR